MFQRAILVNPVMEREQYFGSDKFVQEALVGYKYGTFYKLGFLCERTPLSVYPNEEELK